MAGSSSQLWDAFQARTGSLGEQVAVETAGVELGFGELWTQADRLATRFLESGVREGGVAGLALGNSPLFPAAFLALCRLDATVALLPPQYGRTELKAIADRVGLSSIVAEADGGPRIAAAIPIANASVVEGLRVLVPRVDVRPASRDEVLLKFSSGSTAEPKGIALSADNLLAEAENVTTTLGSDRAIESSLEFRSSTATGSISVSCRLSFRDDAHAR